MTGDDVVRRDVINDFAERVNKKLWERYGHYHRAHNLFWRKNLDAPKGFYRRRCLEKAKRYEMIKTVYLSADDIVETIRQDMLEELRHEKNKRGT